MQMLECWRKIEEHCRYRDLPPLLKIAEQAVDSSSSPSQEMLVEVADALEVVATDQQDEVSEQLKSLHWKLRLKARQTQ